MGITRRGKYTFLITSALATMLFADCVTPLAKKCPGHQRRVAEDGIGDAVGGHLRQPAEEDAEDHHRRQEGCKIAQDAPRAVCL